MNWIKCTIFLIQFQNDIAGLIGINKTSLNNTDHKIFGYLNNNSSCDKCLQNCSAFSSYFYEKYFSIS